MNEWKDFNGYLWKEKINVKQFILDNYTEYTGDDSFLCEATNRTKRLNDMYAEMSKIEIEKGIYDVDTKTVSAIDAYADYKHDKYINSLGRHQAKSGLYTNAKGGCEFKRKKSTNQKY